MPHGEYFTKLAKIAPEYSLEEIYSTNLPESVVGRSCRKVFVSEKEQEHNETNMIEIDLKTSVSEINDVIILQKILFIPAYNDITQNKAPVDAISYLITASKRLKFPDKKKNKKNGVDKLHNFTVNYLKENTSGFGGD